MDNTIKLASPVTVDGEKITELTFRELKVKELIALEKSHGSKGPSESDKYFYAMACGVAPEVIDELGARDWSNLKVKYWTVLGNDPESATAD